MGKKWSEHEENVLWTCMERADCTADAIREFRFVYPERTVKAVKNKYSRLLQARIEKAREAAKQDNRSWFRKLWDRIFS